MAKPVLISGIQPTGSLHIGNYLGALKNFVELQDSGAYECYFFIADYHSLTEPFTKEEKERQVLGLAATFLAAGLDPKRSTLFIQSHVPASTELAWILSALTPFGELRRMTQFKEKGGEKDSANVGLFTYPVLMAADILLYDAKTVPVGEDQLQHLELARTLARKFNAKFGKVFIEPKALMTDVPRLMSLKDPQKKMSKSDPAGCLFLDDAPEAIRKKVMGAVTDSGGAVAYDQKQRPGISNLVLIYAAIGGMGTDAVVKKFSGEGYAPFKQELAELLIQKLAPFRETKTGLVKNSKKVRGAFAEGAEKANAVAAEKMLAVRSALGLL
ncbi:MAG: tryptophan--tRNA ligase [Candidatus Liptonbacteria bacterium RIFCSPHIGHO2_12_FULL_60_13]|uniref:Tryptophan--tRNA ligase n=1 Tax=Candidatus Liptonbacteria bacterium RIFCSPHIGHO2_12_FULL_60_13 TaxID=1798648 RepID=A0A1G2CCJ5_9BACT|nr:MAG: tryptophan--tRNA ligase [Candidatus Liptonbacteria bacterium RIFCSPHIGHO2_12_FULL_60_13]